MTVNRSVCRTILIAGMWLLAGAATPGRAADVATSLRLSPSQYKLRSEEHTSELQSH